MFDQEQEFYYSWLGVTTLAVLYNLFFVIGRGVFWEMGRLSPVSWMVLDYTADLIYLLDLFVRLARRT